MKGYLYKSVIVLTTLFLSYCSIPQEYYEEKEKGNPSKIFHKDAHILLFSAVNELAQRCETFTQSGFNYQVSYLSMMTDSCTESHWERGCTEYQYLNETDVYLCIIRVSQDQCDVTSDNPPVESEAAKDYRFTTFSICGHALRSKTVFPLFL